eukprot:978892-Alexandrium_andersonii.AAC.1
MGWPDALRASPAPRGQARHSLSAEKSWTPESRTTLRATAGVLCGAAVLVPVNALALSWCRRADAGSGAVPGPARQLVVIEVVAAAGVEARAL